MGDDYVQYEQANDEPQATNPNAWVEESQGNFIKLDNFFVVQLKEIKHVAILLISQTLNQCTYSYKSSNNPGNIQKHMDQMHEIKHIIPDHWSYEQKQQIHHWDDGTHECHTTGDRKVPQQSPITHK